MFTAFALLLFSFCNALEIVIWRKKKRERNALKLKLTSLCFINPKITIKPYQQWCLWLNKVSISLTLSEPVRVNLWSSSSFRPGWSANWTSGAASSLTKTLAHFCTPLSHSNLRTLEHRDTHHQQRHTQTQDIDS